ncbi:lipid-transfer protein [Gammaproteobacteria bacterium 45_16_T64]|nr:lipid-transfer protein [Gammaproteobacteria bacterium 45_16_T64]
MSRRVNVIGVGMTKFTKPGDPAGQDYHEMGATAAKLALQDAAVEYSEIEQAWTGYVYGDSCSGMRALYEVGQTGIPIFNVNSNCSTGSSALFAARQAVASGAVEVALVLGFEKMEKGALQAKWGDRVPSLGKHLETQLRLQQFTAAPPAAQMFGGAGVEYQNKYGIADDVFGRIAVKARKHANVNPYALFGDLLTLEQVMASPHQHGPLTRFQCCPPTCGAGATVLCSDEFARKKGIVNPVYIAGQALETDQPSSFKDSMMDMVGYGMAQRAAASVYEQAGIGAEDIDVVELHDCFTANELISYESLGLTPEGTAEKFILEENNTYGGNVVVNPSGGLLSKGHPLGATGLAQCTELVWQLRGQAEKRQVEGAKVALQHNVGIGGACIVTMYRKD